MNKKKEQKTTDELLEEISSKLKCITYLLGIQQFQEGKKEEHIERLNKLGFNNDEVALMVGTSSDSVRATLSKIRRGQPKGKSDAEEDKGH